MFSSDSSEQVAGVQFCRHWVLSESGRVDWKLMYFVLRKHYPAREQYGDTLHFCRHCSILFWKVSTPRALLGLQGPIWWNRLFVGVLNAVVREMGTPTGGEGGRELRVTGAGDGSAQAKPAEVCVRCGGRDAWPPPLLGRLCSPGRARGTTSPRGGWRPQVPVLGWWLLLAVALGFLPALDLRKRKKSAYLSPDWAFIPQPVPSYGWN